MCLKYNEKCAFFKFLKNLGHKRKYILVSAWIRNTLMVLSPSHIPKKYLFPLNESIMGVTYPFQPNKDILFENISFTNPLPAGILSSSLPVISTEIWRINNACRGNKYFHHKNSNPQQSIHYPPYTGKMPS